MNARDWKAAKLYLRIFKTFTFVGFKRVILFLLFFFFALFLKLIDDKLILIITIIFILHVAIRIYLYRPIRLFIFICEHINKPPSKLDTSYD